MSKQILFALLCTGILAFSVASAVADNAVGISAFEQGDYARAIELLSEPAEQGNAEAQFFLAVSIWEEASDPETEKKYAYWLSKSAENGFKMARMIRAGDRKARAGEKHDWEAIGTLVRLHDEAFPPVIYRILRDKVWFPIEGANFLIPEIEEASKVLYAENEVSRPLSKPEIRTYLDRFLVIIAAWAKLAYESGDYTAKEQFREISARLSSPQMSALRLIVEELRDPEHRKKAISTANRKFRDGLDFGVREIFANWNSGNPFLVSLESVRLGYVSRLQLDLQRGGKSELRLFRGDLSDSDPRSLLKDFFLLENSL